MYVCVYIYIYIYKKKIIVINPKWYTGIDRYQKYIVPLAKPIQPLVLY